MACAARPAVQARKDLTAALDEKVNKIDFKTLPLSQAIKEVHGNGTRTLAIFEDPNCPICRVFTKFLVQVPDVTIYRFVYPVPPPESLDLAKGAWCSSDRSSAWSAVVNGARPQIGASCNTDGLKTILEFGARHRILETPTMVLADGQRLVGAIPPDQFMQALNAGGR